MTNRRKITIYYDGSAYTYKWLKTLYVARQYFRDLGYEVRWSSKIDLLPGYPHAEEKTLKRLLANDNDIAFLAFHHSTSIFGGMSIAERAEYLRIIKKHSNMLVWLDTSDSTGTCLFDVMPYVDIYMKKQIMKNKEDYCKPMYGGRIFCDFYYKKIGSEDETIKKDEYMPLAKSEIGKLRVGWNVGLGDLFTPPNTFYGKIALRKPAHLTNPSVILPDDKKTIDIHYRGSGYSPIAGYQRAKFCELIQKANYIVHTDPTQKVPYTKYVHELTTSKAILSPFGWGEICGRDFEAFLYGAILVKPSMQHVITFPNAYNEFETYVPLKWDFSDFDDIMHRLKDGEFDNIAIQAQNAYKEMRSEDGMQAFAKHIIEQIES